MKFPVFILGLLLVVGMAFSLTNVSGCGALSSAGETYTLNASMRGANISFLDGMACIRIMANNVVLDCKGYSITNNASGATYGIVIDQVSGVTVKNCLISNYTYSIGKGGGLYLFHANNNNVTNNTVSNGTAYGFNIYGNNNILDNNTAFNNTYSGFYIHDSARYNNLTNNRAGKHSSEGFDITGTSARSNILINNTAFNNSGSGFGILSSNNNSIINNSAYYNKQSGFSVVSNSDNNTLTDNTAFNNTLNGFDIGGFCKNSTLINNSAYNNSMSGFNITTMYFGTTVNNTAYTNTLYGFYLTSQNNILTNNTAYNNSNGFYLTSTNNNLTGNTAHSNLGNPGLSIPSCGFYLSSSATNNKLISNRAFNHGWANIQLDGGSGNSIINNSAYDRATYSFFISDTGTIIANNSAWNTSTGFYDNVAANNIYTNNSASNNTGYAFWLSPSSNSVFTNNTAYNNSRGFYFNGGSGINLSGNNASLVTGSDRNAYTFDSSARANFTGPNYASNVPANGYHMYIDSSSVVNTNISGAFNNFTTEFITVAFANATSVSMRAMTNTTAGAPKNSTCNYGNCTLITSNYGVMNITNLSVSGSIPALGIYYNTTGVTESTVYIAKYNGTNWQALGQSSINGSTGFVTYGPISTFTPFGVITNGSIASVATNISSCTNITSPGEYNLNANLTGAPNPVPGGAACLKINASNVILNCSGYNITNNVAGTTYGIMLNGTTNVTVKNCPAISNYTYGVYLVNANSSNITNNTAHKNAGAFSLVSGSNKNSFTNNTAYNNSGSGFIITIFGGSNNNFTNNRAYNNSNYGFNLQSQSYNNTLTNNTAWNNSMHGFYIVMATSNYTLINNTALNNSWSGFYLSWTSNNTLINNTAYNNSRGFSLEASSTDNVLTNNTAYNNSEYGFYLDTSSNNVLTNNTAYNSSKSGFFFSVSNGNNLSGNNASLVTGSGGAAYNFTSSSSANFTGPNYASNVPTNGYHMYIATGSVVNTNISGAFNNFTTEFITIAFANATNVSMRAMNSTTAGVPQSDPCGAGICTLITNNKGVMNISNLTVGANIPMLGIYYNTSAETNTSRINISKYVSGAWQMVGQSSINNTTGFITYGPIYSFSPFAVISASSDVSSCMNLSGAGSFVQVANLSNHPNAIPGYAGGGQACIIINASDVTYDCRGNWINNTVYSDPTEYGIAVVGPVRNVTIKNCNIKDYYYGIDIYGANGSVFRNNSITGCEGFRLVNNASMSNDLFTNNTMNDISTTNLSSGFPANSTFSNNTVRVIALTGNNNTIENNTMSGSSTEAVLMRGPACSDNKIRNNDITMSGGSGIGLYDCDGNSIENNAIDPPDTGIIVAGSSNNTFRNNTVADASSYGVHVTAYDVYYSTNNTFIGNNVTNSAYDGFYIETNNNQTAFYNNTANDNGWGGSGSGFNLFAYNVMLDNNTAYNNSQYGINMAVLTPSDRITNNTLQENAVADLSANPADYSAANCHATVTNNIGSGGRPIGYYDYAASVSGQAFSEIILCDADNAVLDNVVVAGSDTLFNNYLSAILSNNLTIKNSESSYNLYGMFISASNATLTNNTALSNDEYGFKFGLEGDDDIAAIGNTAADHETNFVLEAESEVGGSITLINNTAYLGDSGFVGEIETAGTFTLIDNTAYNHSSTGIYLMIEGSDGTLAMINNTAYNNSLSGISFEMIEGEGASGWTFDVINNTAYNNGEDWYAEGPHGGILAIGIQGSSTLLEGNTAYDNENGPGFLVQNSDGASVISNTAYGNDDYGFYISNEAEEGPAPNSYSPNSDGQDGHIIANNTAYLNGYLGYGYGEGGGFYVSGSSGNNLTDNLAYSNGAYGFAVVTNNSVFINNTAYNHTMMGFYVLTSENNVFSGNDAHDNYIFGGFIITGTEIGVGTNNTLTNNSACNNSNGIWVNMDANNTLSNNTVCNNSMTGIWVAFSTGTSISGDHLYNNSVDMKVQTMGNLTLLLDDVIFDNPAGNMINFTTLSMDDTGAGEDQWYDNEVYDLVWSPQPAPLPNGTLSFQGRFINITHVEDTLMPVLDRVAWSWSGDIDGYNVNKLGVWEYNVSADNWTLLNATLNATTNELSVANLSNFSVFAVLHNGSLETAAEGPKPEEQKPLTLSFSSTCSGNLVTVTSKREPVRGAAIRVNGDSVGTTNSSGQLKFSGCGMKDIIINANKAGYISAYIVEDMVSCEQCAVECIDDSDCPEGYECKDGRCVPEECEPACASDEACVGWKCLCKYECCADNDCAEGQSCVANVCENIKCTCGKIEDHACVPYECCADSDCGAGKICLGNSCTSRNDVSCPSTGHVGDNPTCTAKTGDKPCTSCDYVVTDPTGKTFSGKTDEDGNFELPLNIEGTYKVTVFQAGQPVKTIEVKSVPRAPPTEPEKPTAAPDMAAYAVYLLLLLLLAVAAVLYWRHMKGQKAPPPKPKPDQAKKAGQEKKPAQEKKATK